MTQRERWVPAYVGLGSNLDDPARQVAEAISALAQIPGSRLIASSSLYLNPPLGPQDQPDFVNAVAGLVTQLTPVELLSELQGLERQLGRTRKAGDRWGPRVIDLDLLVYGSESIDESGLTVPHPGISERNFVLFPLCDIAPALNVPGQGIVSQLAKRVGDQGLTTV